jgi:hypothetical protein
MNGRAKERAMAKRHKYAKASASISTSLTIGEIAEIAEQAAKEAETLQVMIRLEESKPTRLVYSAQNRVTGGRIRFITFEVAIRDEGGSRSLKTRILTYKQRRQWILVVPLHWQMLAWTNYKRFMHALAAGISEGDSRAKTRVVELAHN